MKKAQMIGQVFIFVLAGLVFILILAYGYKAITGFLERGEEVQLLDFRNELESTVNIIKRDYGSVQRVDLRLPAKTTQVFFVTASPGDVSFDWEAGFRDRYPLLYNAWDAGNENVFLIPRQQTPLLVPDLFVDTGYVCIPAVNGRVSVRMEGTGSKAKLKAWDDEQACD
jgi:hypothetical protein